MSSELSIFRRADRTGIPLLVARLLLGGLFVYTGVEKLGRPVEFLKQIRLYHILPETPAVFLNSTAVVLPWLEITCGVALILGLRLRGAAVVIGGMLVAFTPAIFLRAWEIHTAEGTPFFQIEFDCGCGTGAVIIWKKLLSNTGLLLAAVLAIVMRSRRFCLEWMFGRSDAESAYCARCGYTLAAGESRTCEPCKLPSGFPAAAGDKIA